MQARQRVADGPVDPQPQEALAFGPEDSGVEGEKLFEGHRGQLDHAVGALAAAQRAPADVAVGEHEATALVRGLLSEHAVEPDDPSAGPSERTLEQRGFRSHGRADRSARCRTR